MTPPNTMGQNVALLLAATCLAPAAGYGAPFAARPARRGAVRMDLSDFLQTKAGVSSKFLPQVLAACDDEMIGSVDNLATLADAGLLSSVFKPVIAAGIESALGATGGGGTAVAVAPAVPAAAGASLTLSEVKRMLMLNGQDTWGSEAALRHRLEMFTAMSVMNSAAHWDPAQGAFIDVPQLAEAPAAVPFKPLAVPGPPTDFAGGQWAPTVATLAPPAPAPPPPAPVAVAAPPAPAPAPAPAAPPAAPAADPNKATFTVTLQNPDGVQTVEYDPASDAYLLDYLEELDNAEDYEELPYACRAGSCSACAGKLVSGTVDGSAMSFLSAEQKAEGWILTCTAKPTSDCVIETHKEDDMY